MHIVYYIIIYQFLKQGKALRVKYEHILFRVEVRSKKGIAYINTLFKFHL